MKISEICNGEVYPIQAKLEMPSEMGRSMFGVLDETGLLQYGQVIHWLEMSIIQ